MSISSRTPEGDPNQCPVCGHPFNLERSRPPGDAPCPHCGCLVWYTDSNASAHAAAVVNVTRLLVGDVVHIDRATVDAIIESSPILVLTFREVEHLSAAAIQVLVALHKQVTMKSRRLLLVVPPEKAFIREVFEIARLDTLFVICDSEQEALDRIRA